MTAKAFLCSLMAGYLKISLTVQYPSRQPEVNLEVGQCGALLLRALPCFPLELLPPYLSSLETLPVQSPFTFRTYVIHC